MGTQQTLLREQVAVYERHAASWRADHHAAMACLDLEAALAFGIFIFQEISKVDEKWHADVFTEKRDHDAEHERELLDLYQKWAVPSEGFKELIAVFEAQGFSVEHAEAFRKCVAEVRGVLMPDRHFFAAGNVHALRDVAIDEHRGGKTVEMRSFAD